ncbi:jg6929 [Pararge aegeria aegeria]|uniref:Jg6929 protein n=1 Tax=Pararge aegeria aegeria TaxID=348720 RepID=A0A8S4QWX1_9NEOP|nr:jg6929 [Pararge aegeria aegeria]
MGTEIADETLLEAVRYHGVPPYLRRLLESYLQDSIVEQRLRLAPAGPMLPGTRMLCYEDDTRVKARGSTFSEASRLATVGTSPVVKRIQALGLRVSVPKTEALLFHGPREVHYEVPTSPSRVFRWK